MRRLPDWLMAVAMPSVVSAMSTELSMLITARATMAVISNPTTREVFRGACGGFAATCHDPLGV